MNRKEFITSLIIVIVSAMVPGFVVKKLRKSFFIRPPGAMDEEFFPKVCVRCAQCLRACPAKCLKTVGFEESIGSWATPEIIPRKKGCILCQNCGKVCPSGAIRVVKQELIKIGTAKIYQDECLVWTHKKECLVCLEYCPVQAIYLDEEGRPIVNPEVCTGCGLCEENCPVTSRQAAIRVSISGERRVRLDGTYR